MERWNSGEKRHVDKFRGQSFAALDPGTNGALLVFEAGERYPRRYEKPLQVEQCAAALVKFQIQVLVLESQYVTNLRLARSIVELSFTMGILVGYVARELRDSYALNLFDVAPSTWQAHQRARANESPEKGQAARLMMRFAQEDLGQLLAWRTASPEYRTGIAAAWGIANWWKGLAWR